MRNGEQKPIRACNDHRVQRQIEVSNGALPFGHVECGVCGCVVARPEESEIDAFGGECTHVECARSLLRQYGCDVEEMAPESPLIVISQHALATLFSERLLLDRDLQGARLAWRSEFRGYDCRGLLGDPKQRARRADPSPTPWRSFASKM